MADSIKLPVQLVGMEKAFKEIIDKHNATIAHAKSKAAQIAQTTRQLTKTLEEGLTRQGISTGRYTVPVGGIQTGRKNRDELGRFTGGLETLNTNIVANMEQLAKKEIASANKSFNEREMMLKKRLAGEKKAIEQGEKQQAEANRVREVIAKSERRANEQIAKEQAEANRVREVLARSEKRADEQIGKEQAERNALRQALADQEKKMIRDEQVANRKAYTQLARRERIGYDLGSKEGRVGAVKQEATRLRDIRRDYAANLVDEDFLRKAEDDFRALRRRAWEARRRQIDKDKRDNAAAARERDRGWSQATMGIASAGIGLFGQAGFPLLNIAFASMSGMKYAGIAAVATAAGEAARFIMRLQDAAMQSAESLHLLTKGFRFARAEFEAVKGVYGVYGQSAMQRGIEAQKEFLKTVKGANAAATLASLRTEFGYKFATDLMQTGPLKRLSYGIMPAQILWDPIRKAISGAEKDRGTRLKDLDEAITYFKKLNFSFQSGFEAPEQMWRRMQEAAASRGDDQLQLLRAQLKELIDIRNNQEKELAKGSSFMGRGGIAGSYMRTDSFMDFMNKGGLAGLFFQ